MSLAVFIERNMERLICEWIEFARTRLPASDFMGSDALSNGSTRLLRAIVVDMKSAQSEPERAAKSRGELRNDESALSKVAKQHAQERLKDGFTLDQLVSEYRALRATVIRCWTSDMGVADREMLDELVRFNEAMDQSLTDAVRWFNDGLERTRDIFMGVLGHDLRDPLSTAISATEVQRLTEARPDDRLRANKAAATSLRRMAEMIHNLLDFARTRLDGPLPISPQATNMEEVCREIAEALELSRDCEINLDFSGDLTGTWDPGRVKQVVSNLLRNALQHGRAAVPVEIAMRGETDEIVLSVHNEGTPIPFDQQHTIFDPLVHGVAHEQTRGRRPGSLGLGLYIVKQIVDAHGGTLELQSEAESGTTFTVRLPKSPPQNQRPG